ncbi:hypothetical protein PTKU46_90090 [Paraburkholderia terrae]
MHFTCPNSLAYTDIPTRNVGRATSVARVVQEISLGLGVTIAGIVLQISHTLQGHSTIVWIDFWPAFLAIGLFSLASIPVTLPHNSGGNWRAVEEGGRDTRPILQRRALDREPQNRFKPLREPRAGTVACVRAAAT